MRQLLILLLLSFSISFDASGRENLITALNSTHNDTGKLTAYENLFRYYQYSNKDSAVYYLQEGAKYFTTQKYEKGEARMLYLLGEQYEARGLSAQSEQTEQQALEIYTRSH